MNVHDATVTTVTAQHAATDAAALLETFDTKSAEARATVTAALDELAEFLTHAHGVLDDTQTATFHAHEQIAALHQDAEARGFNARLPLATAAANAESAIGSIAATAESIRTGTAMLIELSQHTQEGLATFTQYASEPVSHAVAAVGALDTAQSHLMAAGE